MHISIQKWGNSLAFRIPHLLAKEAHLRQGERADLQLNRGRLIIVPLANKKWSLKTLVDGIKKKNLHTEIRAGGPIGQEAW